MPIFDSVNHCSCGEATEHTAGFFFSFHFFDVLSSVLLRVRCLICSVVTGNTWVVCMPFRGGPVRANLLVRVDCQAYRPTHFTIWLYSYCRSGTLTVSAHQNTTLTPTAPSERNLHYKPVRVIKTDPHPSNLTSTTPVTFRIQPEPCWDPGPTQILTLTEVLLMLCEDFRAILHILIFPFNWIQQNCK